MPVFIWSPEEEAPWSPGCASRWWLHQSLDVRLGVTRDQLLDHVWGYDSFPLTRTVDTHIAKLRQKIEENPGDPRHIVTVHRAGYKFVG